MRCDRLLALDGEQQILSEARDLQDDGTIDATVEYTYDVQPGPGVTRTRVADDSEHDAPDGRDGVLVFTYDGDSRVIERAEDEIPADGTFRVTTYRYAAGRLVRAGDLEYVHDAGGNLVATIAGEVEPGHAASVTIHDYGCWTP